VRGKVSGGWGRLVPPQGAIELPCEKPRPALAIAQGCPLRIRNEAGFPREAEGVTHLAQRREGDVEKAPELPAAAPRRSLNDIRGSGKRRAADLRG